MKKRGAINTLIGTKGVHCFLLEQQLLFHRHLSLARERRGRKTKHKTDRTCFSWMNGDQSTTRYSSVGGCHAVQNREKDIFKDGSGKLERFLIPDMNIELIEVIARGRAKTLHPKQHDVTFLKPETQTQKKADKADSKPSGEGSGDTRLQPPNAKDEVLTSHDTVGDGDKDEESLLDKILNDTQFVIDELAGDKKLKRQTTMVTLNSGDMGGDPAPTEEDISEKIKDQERARQEALNHLFHQVVLDKIAKEEKVHGQPMNKVLGNVEQVTNMKLDSIRGFKTLQMMRIPPKMLNDNAMLEEMIKMKQKKDLQDEKIKSLIGNHQQKGKSGIQISQSLISLSGQLQPGFSGSVALPPSRLLDLNRRNKLISTHQSLSNQIQQSARYLYSSKLKLEKLKLAHKRLLECYQIKKEQIVEKIKRINRNMKKLHEKNESKLLDKEELFLSPTRRNNKSFREMGDYKAILEASMQASDSEGSPNRFKDPMSLGELKFNANVSPSIHMDQSRHYSRKLNGVHGSNGEDEDSEEEDMYGEAAKIMVKKYFSGGTAGSNSEAIYEILKGDLKRTKLMTEKQLSDLVDHMKENLGIKKDYLDSLAKYVSSLEDTLQKAQRKQRNMYLFLLDHPKDIT